MENSFLRDAHHARLSIGKGTIDLLSPESDESQVQRIVTEKGEGPFALGFAVKDLEKTRQFLEQQGIKFSHKTEGVEEIVLDPGETYGIGINFLA